MEPDPAAQTERGRRWASTMAGHGGGGLRTAHADSSAAIGAAGEVLPRGRPERESAEDLVLAPGATRAGGGGRRAVAEEPDPWRTCFERDRDRILHSAAFRRLAGKTQVFVFPADHQRTRLSHALEVAQVATGIARTCRLNVALTEAIALGHDCGHGPGGHMSEDALGTVRGRWDGGNGPARKRLLIGSHLDTVLDAGKYDGPLGVVAGILAVDHFVRSGKPLGFGIDVLAFGDEEGSRFPATLATSAGCAGAFDPATLRLADGDGVTLAEALRRYGKDVGAIPAAAYRPEDVAAFVEVDRLDIAVLQIKADAVGHSLLVRRDGLLISVPGRRVVALGKS